MVEDTVNSPNGKINFEVAGLGHLVGLYFDSGISQYLGIPYGKLTKRWTRATLADQWEDHFHDGTKYGPCVPVPLFGGEEDGDILTPVHQLSHLKSRFSYNEKRALILNITKPEVNLQKLPVIVYIHGGSWMFGTSNLGIFDGVNLVKESIDDNKPIVHVNLNYRVGYGGFLASKTIHEDLQKNGFKGNGNFGLTDQLLALEWIHKYIPLFGGDNEQITIVGESAGAASVSHHIFSNINPKIQRAVSMSGLSGMIPAFGEDWHEREYQKLLEYFSIKNDSDSLEKLRQVPEIELAQATRHVQNSFEPTTGNPCVDGWYLSENVNMTSFGEPPSWLKGYMFGDTKDEGVIFKDCYQNLNYEIIIGHFEKFVSIEVAENVLNLYHITKNTPSEKLSALLVKLMGDFAFVLPNYKLALNSVDKSCPTFLYHFDEESTLENVLKGTSYHAIDLLYLFGNRLDFNASQKNLRKDFMKSFIKFANGVEPWEPFSKNKKVMYFGPISGSLSQGRLISLKEDYIRNYERLNSVLELPAAVLDHFFLALDAMTNQR